MTCVASDPAGSFPLIKGLGSGKCGLWLGRGCLPKGTERVGEDCGSYTIWIHRGKARASRKGLAKFKERNKSFSVDLQDLSPVRSLWR